MEDTKMCRFASCMAAALALSDGVPSSFHSATMHGCRLRFALAYVSFLGSGFHPRLCSVFLGRIASDFGEKICRRNSWQWRFLTMSELLSDTIKKIYLDDKIIKIRCKMKISSVFACLFAKFFVTLHAFRAWCVIVCG